MSRVDDYNVEGEEEGGEYSDEDDGFIVDDEGRPIKEKKKKRKQFHDAALQEAQDIFGVDFDYDEFEKYDDEYEDDISDDDYIEDEEDGGERRIRQKPQKRRKATRKSIFEIYEPIELKRGHFTDLDNQVNLYLIICYDASKL